MAILPQIPQPGMDPLSVFGATRDANGVLRWPDLDQMLRRARSQNTGDRRWRGWKDAQAEELVALAKQTSRLGLLDINLAGDFNALVYLSTPVPRWPEAGQLRIGDHAIVHLNYQSAWLTDPFPGWMPSGVMSPVDLYLPNAAPAARGALCLGAIAPGTPITELTYLTYYALSLQTATLDETEGVLNPHACEYYRDHPEFMPLTRTGLLDPWSPQELQGLDAILLTNGGRI